MWNRIPTSNALDPPYQVRVAQVGVGLEIGIHYRSRLDIPLQLLPPLSLCSTPRKLREVGRRGLNWLGPLHEANLDLVLACQVPGLPVVWAYNAIATLMVCLNQIATVWGAIGWMERKWQSTHTALRFGLLGCYFEGGGLIQGFTVTVGF